MQSAEPAHAALDRPVFYGSTIILAAVLLLAALFPSTMDILFADMQSSIIANASWYYVLVVAVILISVVIFAFSSYGQIKLGPDHWSVIFYLREHHLENGSLPVMSHVCRVMHLGKYAVEGLFGGCREAWRIAGLPNPGEEAKSYMN